MTDLFAPLTPPNPAAPKPRPCPHPRRYRRELEDGITACLRCGADISAEASRKGRNARKRGGAAELAVARTVGGRKMGPLGLPWDVEIPGYARLQVRKYATPESLRKIAAELARIGSGAEMPGYVWIEPGRGGERLIVFRLSDYSERHGAMVATSAHADAIQMDETA